MKEASPQSAAASVAVAALGLCGYVGAWLILVLGGFHHKPYRHAQETIFVDGLPAVAMAVLFLSLAGLGLTAVLRSSQVTLPWRLVAWAAFLLPPIVYVGCR